MPLEIDELILLGAPIQRQTERYVASPIFKKIYNFYSRSDHVQKKDLFSSQQLFSKRVFANRREWSLPPSLTQIEVKMLKERPNPHKKWHRISESVLHPAANISKRGIVRGSSWSLQNVSPGHTEMWFMAWTPRNYRADFPLYPVPIITVTPYIIQMIETTQPQSQTSRKIVADIRPDYNYMILRHRFPKKQHTIVSFLPKNSYKELHDLAMINKPPDGYTKQEHDKKRALAKEQAHNDIREKRKKAKDKGIEIYFR